MSRPARAYVLGLFVMAIVAVAVVAGIRGIDYVTRHTTTVQTHHQTVVVTMPCVRGNDQACRTFIRLLLSDATRAELRTLLGAEAIHVPARGLPRLLKQLHRLLRPHHRRHRHRPTVIRPPNPFSPIPPTAPVAPTPPVKPPKHHGPKKGVVPPGHGNGLPGRPGIGQGRPTAHR